MFRNIAFDVLIVFDVAKTDLFSDISFNVSDFDTYTVKVEYINGYLRYAYCWY